MLKEGSGREVESMQKGAVKWATESNLYHEKSKDIRGLDIANVVGSMDKTFCGV